ncbi:MAG: hypothetical protein LBI13_06165 [Streptococcaceae bacterium]|jgi:hypothetical protein|nr:hypothetical protein [Streptococcaceae bacterium]
MVKIQKKNKATKNKKIKKTVVQSAMIFSVALGTTVVLGQRQVFADSTAAVDPSASQIQNDIMLGSLAGDANSLANAASSNVAQSAQSQVASPVQSAATSSSATTSSAASVSQNAQSTTNSSQTQASKAATSQATTGATANGTSATSEGSTSAGENKVAATSSSTAKAAKPSNSGFSLTNMLSNLSNPNSNSKKSTGNSLWVMGTVIVLGAIAVFSTIAYSAVRNLKGRGQLRGLFMSLRSMSFRKSESRHGRPKKKVKQKKKAEAESDTKKVSSDIAWL